MKLPGVFFELIDISFQRFNGFLQRGLALPGPMYKGDPFALFHSIQLLSKTFQRVKGDPVPVHDPDPYISSHSAANVEFFPNSLA